MANEFIILKKKIYIYDYSSFLIFLIGIYGAINKRKKKKIKTLNNSCFFFCLSYPKIKTIRFFFVVASFSIRIKKKNKPKNNITFKFKKFSLSIKPPKNKVFNKCID